MWKQHWFLVLLFLSLCFITSQPTKATGLTAPFILTVVGEDGRTPVAGVEVKITRLDLQIESATGSLATVQTDFINSNTDTINLPNTGIVTTDKYETGRYAITLKKNNISMTTVINHKVTRADIPKSIKLVFLADASHESATKLGSIGGSLTEKTWLNDNTITDAIILVQSKTTTWKTTTSDGFFQLYLHPGTYKVTVVVGTDLANPAAKRSYFSALTVVRGMNVTPIKSETPKVIPSTLGYQLDTSTVSNSSTTYKGQANNGAKVSVYSVSGTTYQWLGEVLVKNSKYINEGTFAIKIPKAQPGATLIFMVEDQANLIYVSNPMAFSDVSLEVSADNTKNELGQPIDLMFKDLTKLYGKTAKVEMRFIPTTGIPSAYVELVPYDTRLKSGDYTTSNGKITILAKTFFKDPFFYATDGKYEIQITQEGFVTKTVEQTVTSAVSPATSLSVTATPGSVAGSARLTVGTASDITKIYYEIGSAPLTRDTIPKAYKEVTADILANTLTKYNIANGITDNIDPVTNKYLRVYEVVEYEESGATKQRVIAFKEITLSTTTMNGRARYLDPSLFPIDIGSAAGQIKITALPTLSADATAFKYAVTASGTASKTQAIYKSLATEYSNALVQDADITAKTGDTLYIVEVDNDNKVLSWTSITVP